MVLLSYVHLRLFLPQGRAGFCSVFFRKSFLDTRSLCGSAHLTCLHVHFWRAEVPFCLHQLWEGDSLKIRPLKLRKCIWSRCTKVTTMILTDQTQTWTVTFSLLLSTSRATLPNSLVFLLLTLLFYLFLCEGKLK